jgi:hypothetical protein
LVDVLKRWGGLFCPTGGGSAGGSAGGDVGGGSAAAAAGGGRGTHPAPNSNLPGALSIP